MTIRRLLIRAAAIASFALLAASRPALGAPPDMMRAFEQGRTLVRDGKYEEAIAKFRESIAIEPSVGAWLNIGDCDEKLARYASAKRAFLEAAKLAGDADPNRAAEARSRAAHVEASIAWIVFDLAAETQGDPAIALDGESLPPGTRRVAVDSGHHAISVTFAGNAPDERSVTVHPAETTHLDITPASHPVEKEHTSSSLATLQWVGIGAGAAGVIAAGIGGIFGIVAIGKHDDLASACPSYPQCPSAARDDVQPKYDDANRAATIATVGLVTGGVLVAAGVVLYLVAPNSRVTTAQSGGAIRF